MMFSGNPPPPPPHVSRNNSPLFLGLYTSSCSTPCTSRRTNLLQTTKEKNCFGVYSEGSGNYFFFYL